jgi:DNA-binding Xre family transcriptional regulator
MKIGKLTEEGTMTHLRIKELAEAEGLNIKTLSEKAELAWTTVQPLWHETAKRYDHATLDRIAVALDVKVSDLFGGDPIDTRTQKGKC